MGRGHYTRYGQETLKNTNKDLFAEINTATLRCSAKKLVVKKPILEKCLETIDTERKPDG